MVVVVASEGYPENPRSGDPIEGAEGLLHAGTRVDEEGVLRSAGGRVLCATGVGPSLAAARAEAYAAAARVRLRGSHYRTDIALAAAS